MARQTASEDETDATRHKAKHAEMQMTASRRSQIQYLETYRKEGRLIVAPDLPFLANPLRILSFGVISHLNHVTSSLRVLLRVCALRLSRSWALGAYCNCQTARFLYSIKPPL